MENIQTILNSQQAPQTLIMMTGQQLKELIDGVAASTRRIIEEQYQPKYFTMEDMTSLFSCSVSTVYNWITAGKIKAYKMEEHGRTYFDQGEIREAMRRGIISKRIH